MWVARAPRRQGGYSCIDRLLNLAENVGRHQDLGRDIRLESATEAVNNIVRIFTQDAGAKMSSLQRSYWQERFINLFCCERLERQYFLGRLDILFYDNGYRFSALRLMN